MDRARFFLPAFFIALISFALVTKGFAKQCSLPDDSVPSFRWKGGKPYFLDETYSECDLLVKPSPTVQPYNRTINVLSFGDSFELGLCLARRSGYNSSVFQFVQHSSESKWKFALCSRYNEPITYMVRRVYGQDGEPRQIWENSGLSSLHIINEMAHHFSSGPSTNSSDKPVIGKVNVVVFGSFVWDLVHWHASWCQKILKEHSRREENATHIEFCGHGKLSSTSVTSDAMEQLGGNNISSDKEQKSMDVETILQSWGRMTVPWCDAAILLNWQQTYLREVRALLAAFPQAVLFLRTQPISSAVLFGNEHCHGPMNAFILQVWATYQHLLLQNANGTTIGRRVRLIAMHELFEAPNDNGVDHFSADNIHLTDASSKIYRDYVMRVLDEYRRSSSQ